MPRVRVGPGVCCAAIERDLRLVICTPTCAAAYRQELQGPPNNKALALAKKLVDREFKESDDTDRAALRATLDHCAASSLQGLGGFSLELQKELGAGYAAEQARVQADPGLSLAEKKSRLQALSAALEQELSALREQERLGKSLLDVGFESTREKETAALQGRLSEARQARLDHLMEVEGRTEKEAVGAVDAEESKARADLEAALKCALKGNQLAAKEAFEAKKLETMAQHEARLHGLVSE